MIYGNRDMGINHIITRKDHSCYGMGLGIIILDDAYPGFPGDVRNASAFPYPIQYELVKGVDIKKLVFDENQDICLESILKAAKKLEQMGCRAIAAECGYFAYFQKEVAAHVDVPVFMSSLLQVPFARQLISPDKYVGIICAQKRFLSKKHLEAVGIDTSSNILVAGALDEYGCQEFINLWDPEKRPLIPEVYYEKANKEFVSASEQFCYNHPEIGALVLECTGMQPFARSLQHKVDLPIFSWGTLLDYAFSVSVHRDYYGHV